VEQPTILIKNFWTVWLGPGRTRK